MAGEKREPRKRPAGLPDQTDELVGEALVFLGGCGKWSQFIQHMEAIGWSEKEVDAAFADFGSRIGRDL